MPGKEYLISISFFFFQVPQIYRRLYFIGFGFPHYRTKCSDIIGWNEICPRTNRWHETWSALTFSSVLLPTLKNNRRSLFSDFSRTRKVWGKSCFCAIAFIQTGKLLHMEAFNSFKTQN